MKKMIFIFLLLSGISSAYAKNITIDSSITTSSIILDEGTNYLKNHLSNKKIGFTTYSGNNSQLVGIIGKKNGIYANSGSQSIKVTCKNGYITYVNGYKNLSPSTNPDQSAILSGLNVESLDLSAGVGNDRSNFVTIKCKPITQPAKQFQEKATNINYQSVSTDPKTALTYSITTPINPELSGDVVKQQLSAGTEVSSQPTFVDILYLQLKTISNLSTSVLTKHPNLDFSSLFQNTTNTGYNFIGYSNWINKFSKYATKKEFQDAFTGAIGLKDIGIAQDVINGLIKCLNNNSCNGVIKFQHNINDKYDTYTLNQIGKTLYNGNPNILDSSINYYSNLKDKCSNTTISDTFLKTQIKDVCNNLFTGQIDPNNLQNYDLGYSLGIRVKNLTNIKNNIPTSGLNLKGIFNIYWELNNLTLGTTKATIVKSIKNTDTLTGQYNKLKKVFSMDLNELNNQKVEDNSFIIKKQAIIQTAMKALTPGSTLNIAVKSQNPNVNLFNDNNFLVNAGVSSIKGVAVSDVNIYKLKDLTKISTYSNKVKIIFQSYGGSYKNSIGFYEEDNGKPKDGKIVIKNIKNIKKYSSGYVIYSGEIDKGLFIVSNGNLDKGSVEFYSVDHLFCNSQKSNYDNINHYCGKDFFFDNSSYNYKNWQASKIELYDGYALMKIEDKYKEQKKKYNMVFKIVPIK